MSRRLPLQTTLSVSVGVTLFSLLACSESDPQEPYIPGGTGGTTPASGGSTAATGGSTAATGGSTAATGGSTAASGGSPASGGTSSGGAASGGASAGGTSSGGASSGGSGSGGDAAGGAASGGDSGTGGGEGSGGASSGEFSVTSAEFNDGEMIPDAHTCAGPDGFQGAPSPSFSWSGAPAETMSYAMIMIDETLVDEGNANGYHSAFWNLPASTTELPVRLRDALPQGTEVINNGYLGPCPNFNSDMGNEDTYVFTFYAMPAETASPPGGMVNAAFIDYFEGEALATTSIRGTSSAVGGL